VSRRGGFSLSMSSAFTLTSTDPSTRGPSVGRVLDGANVVRTVCTAVGELGHQRPNIATLKAEPPPAWPRSRWSGNAVTPLGGVGGKSAAKSRRAGAARKRPAPIAPPRLACWLARSKLTGSGGRLDRSAQPCPGPLLSGSRRGWNRNEHNHVGMATSGGAGSALAMSCTHTS